MPPRRRRPCGPLRTVLYRRVNASGDVVEILECGHRVTPRADPLGRPDAGRRRCRWCQADADAASEAGRTDA